MACPGYPYENCGDQSAGLFGYVALGPSPSGTQGSAPSSSAAPYSSPSPVVSYQVGDISFFREAEVKKALDASPISIANIPEISLPISIVIVNQEHTQFFLVKCY